MDQHLAMRIDDCISWWHADPADVPLHTYVGMTLDEYGHWFTTGELAPAHGTDATLR